MIQTWLLDIKQQGLVKIEVLASMNGENWPLVTDEPVVFEINQFIFKTAEKLPLDHYGGIYRRYLKLIKKNPKTINM